MRRALENRLGITDPEELARAEERISKRQAVTLAAGACRLPGKPGSLEALRAIHWQLFSDIYDFAGEIRNVDLAKGTFRFAAARFLMQSLADVEKMPQAAFDEAIAKYIEMNIVHPFREGNGRSLRLWLDQILAHELGQVIDWSRIPPAMYLKAMEQSPVHPEPLKALLEEALTDRTADPAFLMAGLDASWEYEGQCCFQARDLVKSEE